MVQRELGKRHLVGRVRRIVAQLNFELVNHQQLSPYRSSTVPSTFGDENGNSPSLPYLVDQREGGNFGVAIVTNRPFSREDFEEFANFAKKKSCFTNHLFLSSMI